MGALVDLCAAHAAGFRFVPHIRGVLLMLCSIVHKNMGGKWEAFLARIFVVGGRFPTYPAMPSVATFVSCSVTASLSLASSEHLINCRNTWTPVIARFIAVLSCLKRPWIFYK